MEVDKNRRKPDQAADRETVCLSGQAVHEQGYSRSGRV